MEDPNRSKSASDFRQNEKYIPGGVVSSVRKVEPEIAFVRGEGAYLWDADGNRYIDYHAAFAPHLLGHGDDHVTEAVEKVIRDASSLYGTGANALEGKLAELLCTQVEALERVEFCSTGTENSMAAVRNARAARKAISYQLQEGFYPHARK